MAKFIYANTKNADMRYLVEVDILDDFFLIEKKDGGYFIFLDNRELEMFREKNKKAEIVALPLEDVIEKIKSLKIEETSDENKVAFCIASDYLKGEILEVQKSFSFAMADFLLSQGIILKIKDPFLPERMIKSEFEKEKIKGNLKSTQKAFLRIEEILKKSKIEGDMIIFESVPLTSEFLKKECEKVLLEENMFDLEGMIISCGNHSSMPHHPGEGLIRPHQAIVCDIFPWKRENGYYADMTRTYVKGKPAKKLIKLYEAVKEVQEFALTNVKAGIKNIDLHLEIQNYFLKLGYHAGKQGFIHGTGHGLGLEIHELPYINSFSKENDVLQVGNVITIEPGLYYPNLGGVRIEDVVYVTDNGCENMTDYPKNFIIP